MLTVRELDGRHIGTRAGAPPVNEPIRSESVTDQMQALYRQAVRGELDDFRHWLTL